MTEAATNASTRRQRHGLPAEVTSFVGRRHEVAEVKRLLSGSRMVTLTGVAGVGKTRLASRVAGEVLRAFPDGVRLVELAELRDGESLAHAVAEALGLRSDPSRPALDVLIEQLRDKRVLLVLDNCEHLLRHCAMLAETLLRTAPELRILATSRQALGIASEHVLAVPPLRPPGFDGSPPAGTAAQNDGVRLFSERAKAVLPEFAVTEGNQAAVEDICRRLDGIPLGIELAAVRLRALSVRQLLDRLDDRFGLLTTGSPAVPRRHQTLRALIDWSYALCTGQERLLWARASVFSGALDLEAAEAICSGDGIAREEVLDLVTGLVDKSVLIREEYSSGVRYRLLETIRQYGRERLVEAGEEAALRLRHRDYYRRLSAEARAQLFGAAQVGGFGRLKLERANLLTALEDCFAEPAEVASGLRMATDLLYHWITGSGLDVGRRRLDQGLALHTGPSEVRARALWANGCLAVLQGDTGPAAALLEESRALGERLGDESVLGYAALFSGMVAMSRGEPYSAISRYEEAEVRHRATGDPVGLAMTLLQFSLARCILGDLDRAVAVAEECRTICDAHGEGWHRTYALTTLAIAAWRQGDTRRATALAKESLRLNRSADDRLGTAINLEVLAWIAATEVRHRRAAQLLGVLRVVWGPTGAALSGFAPLPLYHDECAANCRAALSGPTFRTAVKQGAELTYEAALAYALEDRAPADGPAEAKAPSPLTPRETEIAELVVKGLSNKDIAAALTIAQRTAEGHIEHILSKLGFNSRTQIAVWVGERNLGAEQAGLRADHHARHAHGA